MSTAADRKPIKVTISVEVDPAAWNEANGDSRNHAAIRRDFVSYLLSTVRESPLVSDSGASVTVKT